MNNKTKNIAIIAHVDHGKTTLVDAILRQSGTFKQHEKVEERVMDRNDIEKERGITIFSKNASFKYKDYKINIVDTPGHADFGGEVQRIMKMVDSVLLLVDAFEGAMPQTKYVLKKSLENGLRPIVIINKIDRPNSRPEEVLDMVFELFLELNANDYQLDFPVLYASAKNGFAKYNLEDENVNLEPLFETILKYVDDTEGDRNKTLQFLVSNIEYDNYVGKMGSGKIANGTINFGDNVMLVKKTGQRTTSRISKIYTFDGLNKIETPVAYAGDIVSIAGIDDIDVGETVTDPSNPMPLPIIDIDEPTLAMTFMVNDSPFAGKEGKHVTSRKIWDRLQKELQSNVSLKVEATEKAEAFTVKGRGELQLSILLENMRREGYEIQVSKPHVIFKEIDGVKCEPIEMVMIDVADEYIGIVIEKLGIRKGEMVNMTQGNDGYSRLEFKIPARGLIGFRNEFMTDTKGTGIINQSFYDYEPHRGAIPSRTKGILASNENGTSIAYALNNLQDRGVLFIEPGTEVYEGMIVGEHSRENDLAVNVCKGKKLTNMRASGSDDATKLSPPRRHTLEQALEYIADDELVEITPESIRMRKKILQESQRRRSEKKKD